MRSIAKSENNTITLCHNLNFLVLREFSFFILKNNIGIFDFKVELLSSPNFNRSDFFGNELRVTFSHELIRITEKKTGEILLIDPWINQVSSNVEVTNVLVQCNRYFFIYNFIEGKLTDSKKPYFSRSRSLVPIDEFIAMETSVYSYVTKSEFQEYASTELQDTIKHMMLSIRQDINTLIGINPLLYPSIVNELKEEFSEMIKSPMDLANTMNILPPDECEIFCHSIRKNINKIIKTVDQLVEISPNLTNEKLQMIKNLLNNNTQNKNNQASFFSGNVEKNTSHQHENQAEDKKTKLK